MGKAAIHKDNLVRTAVTLFRRQGYASTGLQEILEKSGAPKGSLYHYFPQGKEQLGEAAVLAAGRAATETLNELAEKHREPAAFFKAYLKRLAGWMKSSGYRSGCPIATTILETVPQSAAIAAAGERIMDDWIAVAAGVYERAGVPRAEARARAQFAIAAAQGALILSRLRRSTKPLDDAGKRLGRLG